MIEAMRSKAASWIAKILALFLILSFAVWGIGDMVPGQGVTQTVATLDDVKIEKDLIVNKLQSSVNVMRAALGPQFDNRQAVKLGFLERALDEIIEETLLQKELDNLKLEVGESTIRRAIYDDPRFKGTGGSIDRQAFQNYLRQEGISESQFISILRNQIRKNQLLSAYTSGIEAPDILVEKLTEYGSEKRIAEILTIPYRKAKSFNPPDPETLKKFYQENKILFRTPEYRDITAIYLDPTEFGKSITPPSDKVRENFEALKASASLPERRDFSQILILSDKRLNLVQNGFKIGKTFEQVSKDATGKAPQALGALSKNEMLPTIAEAAFKLKLNEVTKPIKTALGWHILRLNKVEAARTATLEDLRPKIIEQLKREIATDEIIQITGRIDDKIAAGLTLENAASAVGINVVKFSRVDSLGNTIGGVRVAGFPKSRRFLDLTTQLEPGENSAIEEANNGSYFVLRVDKIYEPTIPEIKDVQEQAIFAWKQNQVQK
ncbi:MAG: SurA N-terminal domain-containing protein, partial [Alphaproteobacteria bacterium]